MTWVSWFLFAEVNALFGWGLVRKARTRMQSATMYRRQSAGLIGDRLCRWLLGDQSVPEHYHRTAAVIAGGIHKFTGTDAARHLLTSLLYPGSKLHRLRRKWRR